MLPTPQRRTRSGQRLSVKSAHARGRPDHALILFFMQPHLIEQASKVIPSTQFLVNVMSRRVRQLMNGHRPLVETNLRMGLADIALTEIIEGKVTFERTVGFIAEPIAPRPPRASDGPSEPRAA